MRKVKVPLGEEVRTWGVLHGTTIRFSRAMGEVHRIVSETGEPPPDTLSIQAAYLASSWVGKAPTPSGRWPTLRDVGSDVVSLGDIAVDAFLEAGLDLVEITRCATELFNLACEAMPNTKDREGEVKDLEGFSEAQGKSTQG